MSALAPGTRVGPHEIVQLIGSGGVGEVYRATDTRLNRQVALKVLPAALTADPDRLSQPPQPSPALGLEETNGVKALVMELAKRCRMRLRRR